MGFGTCLRILSCSCSEIFGDCCWVPTSLERFEGTRVLVDDFSDEDFSGTRSDDSDFLKSPSRG
jgi:hypothetical protein